MIRKLLYRFPDYCLCGILFLVFFLSPSHSHASNPRDESPNAALNHEEAISGVTFEYIVLGGQIPDFSLAPVEIFIGNFEVYITDEQHQNFQCTAISDLPPGYTLGVTEVDTNGTILQFIPFDNSGIASFTPVSFAFTWSSMYKPNEPQFSYSEIWSWDFDFSIYKGCIKSGDNYIFANTTECTGISNIMLLDWGFLYPNHVALTFNNFRDYYCPEFENYGFIDAQGNKTQGDYEIIPNYYFTAQPTPLKLYVTISGKEHLSSNFSSVYFPGVRPPEIVPTTQTVTIDFVPFLAEYDVDNDFGRLEYDDIKIIFGHGKALLPHKTGYYEYQFRHLPPDTEFEITFIPYYVRYSTEERIRIDGGIQPVITGKTAAPYWYGGLYQAISSNKARVIYPTSLQQTTDSYVEWREVGSTDETDIHRAEGPVVNGQLIGILEGLDPTANYEYRPVYEIDGRRYAGDWVQVTTAGAEGWYEPAIYAQPSEIEEDESVTLRGAVLPGSGEVTEQGFEIWPQETAQNTGAAAGHRAEASHRFIPCEGISMSANLSDLTPGNTYLYRVYATADGKTVTGNTASISVPGGVSDIGCVTVFEEETPEVVGYYNLQGVRSERPFDGMNIVVYSNGKTEKRIFKNL